MGNIRLYGSTSGYVEIAPPAVGGSQVLTLPTDTVSPGMVLVSQQSFSNVSSVSFNNCFSSSYENYRIVGRITASSNNTPMYIRMRSAGVDAASAGTYDEMRIIGYQSSSLVSTGNSDVAFVYACYNYSGDPGAIFTYDIHGPNLAQYTFLNGQCRYGTGSTLREYMHDGGVHKVASAYDGLSLIGASANITGTARIYGYRN